MISHQTREFSHKHPHHCVLKTDVKYSLQQPKTLKLIKHLIKIVGHKYGVHIFQYFIQRNHVHLFIGMAVRPRALARGI